jgi:hypothetical protein
MIPPGTPEPTLADHWAALVSAALLGTDRRPPPPAPAALGSWPSGPDEPTALGSWSSGPDEPLAPTAPPGRAPHSGDDATDVLDQVAALTVMRRAGIRAEPAPPMLQACDPDERPVCPPAAARRLGELLEAWPVLVDEWLERLDEAGHRLPPEHVAALLAGHRVDPARRARVASAAGPLAQWITDLFPELLAPRRAAVAPTHRRSNGTAPGGAARGLASGQVTAPDPVADAPGDLSPDLVPLLAVDADELARALVEGLDRGRWLPRHRPLLARLVCRVDPAALPRLVDALGGEVRTPSAVHLAADLADLARTRADMLAELTAPNAEEPSE